MNNRVVIRNTEYDESIVFMQKDDINIKTLFKKSRERHINTTIEIQMSLRFQSTSKEIVYPLHEERICLENPIDNPIKLYRILATLAETLMRP